MKTPQFIIFLLLCLNPVISFSQPINYSLKQNIVQWSECDNPQNGFILTGKTVTRTANNDSFILNTNKEVFSWNDNKGQSENKIYHFQSKNSDLNIQYVFLTEHNSIRITTNKYKEAVIEIVCLINSKWYCLSYLCQETTSPQTIINENPVTDIDGNVYKTVRIGNQIWMAEDLKVAHYRNGDPICNIERSVNLSKLTSGAWCYNNSIFENETKHGNLYNWFAVTDSRDIAPYGWHIPTYTEWTNLVTYLGGESVAGDKLREAGVKHWESPNAGATNKSGFTALPGGARSHNLFDITRSAGFWWSSTANNNDNAFYFRIEIEESLATSRSTWEKGMGLSVRCIRN